MAVWACAPAPLPARRWPPAPSPRLHRHLRRQSQSGAQSRVHRHGDGGGIQLRRRRDTGAGASDRRVRIVQLCGQRRRPRRRRLLDGGGLRRQKCSRCGRCRSGRCWRAVPVGQNLVAGTAASAVLGGLGSVAAGGKFADGAVTASFGYLLNAVLHVERSVKLPDAVQCYLCKLLVCIGGAYAVGIAISYPSGYAVLAGREKSDWDLGWFTTKDINVNVPLQTQPSSSWFHKQIFSFGVGKNSDGFDSFSGQSSFAGGTLGIFSAEQSFRSDDGKPYGGTLRIGAPGSSGYAGVATTCVRSWSGARYGC